jgi:hypothetical protein
LEASPEDCFRDAKCYVILLKWLYTSRDYASQFGRLRGHSGMGPEGVGTLGTAAYANVPTRPTNNSNALSERFIDFLLRVCRRLWVKLPASGVANYTQPCNFLINRRLLRDAKQCDTLTGMPNNDRAVRQAI